MAQEKNAFPQDAQIAIEQSRTVLSSEIRVGHSIDNPLEQSGQIGLVDTAPSLQEIDRFVFVTDNPAEIEIYAPTAPAPTGFAFNSAKQVEKALPLEPEHPGIAWALEVRFDGRQELTPANDLLQTRLGNRVEGSEQIGGRQADILIGTDGDDVLIGAQGDDVLTGGAGADVFVFSQSSTGRDRITDFTVGEDHLYFAAETLFDLDEITLTQSGDDVLLSWHRGNSELILEDVIAQDLGADSFILAAA